MIKRLSILQVHPQNHPNLQNLRSLQSLHHHQNQGSLVENTILNLEKINHNMKNNSFSKSSYQKTPGYHYLNLILNGIREDLKSTLQDVITVIFTIIIPDIQKMNMFMLLMTWAMTYLLFFLMQKL